MRDNLDLIPFALLIIATIVIMIVGWGYWIEKAALIFSR